MQSLIKQLILVCLMFLSTTYLYAQNPTLTIEVITPANTPKTDSLIVIGNQDIWGNWIYPIAARMNKINDSTWAQSESFPTNTSVNFMITRGSYYKEALYNNSGQIAPSITFNLQKDTTIVLRPTSWNDLYQRSITGTVRYYHNFNSPLLKYTRDIIVWLPPSYFKEPNKKYPVLYAEDGQNILIILWAVAMNGIWTKLQTV